MPDWNNFTPIDIDELVIAQADDITAWEEPVEVLISQQTISLPPELAKGAFQMS